MIHYCSLCAILCWIQVIVEFFEIDQISWRIQEFIKFILKYLYRKLVQCTNTFRLSARFCAEIEILVCFTLAFSSVLIHTYSVHIYRSVESMQGFLS